MSIEHDSGPVGGGAPRCNRGREADVIWARGAADGTGGGEGYLLPPSAQPLSLRVCSASWSLALAFLHRRAYGARPLQTSRPEKNPSTPADPLYILR